MFDQPGIGLEDLAWIHRDKFVHYVQLAHAPLRSTGLASLAA